MDTRVAALGLGSDAELLRLREGVLYLLRRELADPARAEDLCNEAFRVVLERLSRKSLEDPDRLASYLAQTARNLVTGERRKSLRRRTDTGRQTEIDSEPDPQPDSLAVLESRSRTQAVRQVLLEFPYLRDREVLVRAYLYDQEPEQICRELGIAPDSYRKVTFRARERFRTLIERRYPRRELYGLAFI